MNLAAALLAILTSGCMFVFDRDGGPGGGDDPDGPYPYYPDAYIVPDANPGAACMGPEGPGVPVTQLQVLSAIAGRWYRCGGADEFGGKSIEVTANGSFYFLELVNGAYVRSYGPTSSGTLMPLMAPTGLSFAVDQTFADGSGPIYALQGQLMSSPRKMRLGGGTYVGMP